MTPRTPREDARLERASDRVSKNICEFLAREWGDNKAVFCGTRVQRLVREFARREINRERRETVRKCAEVARHWEAFYTRMQEKSRSGEKDGMYRMFAAQDIGREILKKLATQSKKGRS
jgi:hypothetical protein